MYFIKDFTEDESDMQINLISCKNRKEEKEAIQILKDRYSPCLGYKYVSISETIRLPNEKWIVTPSFLIKQLTRRKPQILVYNLDSLKEMCIVR